MSHTHALKRFRNALFSVAGAHTAIRQRQLNVFVNRQIADQIEALKNEADFAIANARPI
jgi:hypothetical protein